MKLSIVSVLSFASAMVSASAIPRGLDTSTANVTEKCIEPKLCCKKLTTPLDPLVDGLLGLLDINGKAVTGEVGLLCMYTWFCNIYWRDSC